MTNIDVARATIAHARSRGVVDFAVCAGSRNSPLLAVLAATEGVRLTRFVDERSAAFFALGRAKRDRRPAAVVTTSGTAVAELLPAAIEAHYSGIELILITADRPARYRGTGAPQAIEQEHLFGVYGKYHINVEFDEPLIDAEIKGAEEPSPLAPGPSPLLPSPLITFKRPLVIMGGLAPHHRAAVRTFVNMLSASVYAEPLSGLREELNGIRNERILARGDFDGVIRIGNVPTLRFWRDLDGRFAHLPVIHFSDLPFTGLPRGDVHPIEALPIDVEPRPRNDDFLQRDRELAERVSALIDGEPDSEPAVLRALASTIPHGGRVYLGNSLPIREWDMVAPREPRGLQLEANRGANGIDGQLSTFFGWCEPGAENWCILGDLTALYDLNAPWVVPQLDASFRIVIVNNSGGRIFERVATGAPQLALNEHALDFAHWAAMFGIKVTELRPDNEATRRFWQRFDELWR